MFLKVKTAFPHLKLLLNIYFYMLTTLPLGLMLMSLFLPIISTCTSFFLPPVMLPLLYHNKHLSLIHPFCSYTLQCFSLCGSSPRFSLQFIASVWMTVSLLLCWWLKSTNVWLRMVYNLVRLYCVLFHTRKRKVTSTQFSWHVCVLKIKSVAYRSQGSYTCQLDFYSWQYVGIMWLALCSDKSNNVDFPNQIRYFSIK